MWEKNGNRAVGEDRMVIKKGLKEKSITPQQAAILERAVKLERMLPTMNSESLLKFGKEAENIIANIKAFDQERSAEIEIKWNNRESELEVT